MPAVSQAQRGFLAHKFGVPWMREHHFTNRGPLPQYVHAKTGNPNIGGALYRQKLATANKIHARPQVHPLPNYPPDHQVGAHVPLGGSSCSTCKYVSQDGQRCGNKNFIYWNNGDDKLPFPDERYCCDFWQLRSGVKL